MRVNEWRRQAAYRLSASGSPDPQADAKLISWGDALRELPPGEEHALNALLERRLTGEPVQYVLKSAWFMGLEFYVDRRVLIPRQDTETLCERALEILKPLSAPTAIDLCAGSGVIGLSIAKLCPQAKVTLADVSEGACEVIQKNRERLCVLAEVVRGDLFAPVSGRTFDMILCNPPYVRTGEMDALQREVRKEPRLALDGGTDGLDFYRRIAPNYLKHLNPGGHLILETGFDQADEVVSLFGRGEVLKDLCGLNRAVVIEHNA